MNGIITFPPRKTDPVPHQKLLEAAINIPDEFLVLETDAPYLTPEPKRGERNHPTNVLLVAERLVVLRHTNATTLLVQTTENALRLFSKIPKF